ncbi:hypothetical protein QLH52_00120 [Methylomonas sp. OY6]|uniref:Uncharacterized protein n=1 Tax=Methylomonas defluvii TaxID=3045149 RepID=A0ABU4U8C5_9GAMM|nr:hypothetical protein [Methylomonas sp. OY6]MDX8125677.1 hypothetical protein [Methylomonas sp. OY6]
MNISNIGPSLAASRAVSGKTLPSPAIAKIAEAADQSQAPRTVDMRRVSLNEINALIKSGVDGLLDVVPYIPTATINSSGAGDAGDVKVDYLGQIEAQIEFQKSRHEDTAFLEKVLSNVKRLDGMALPPKLDVMA